MSSPTTSNSKSSSSSSPGKSFASHQSLDSCFSCLRNKSWDEMNRLVSDSDFMLHPCQDSFPSSLLGIIVDGLAVQSDPNDFVKHYSSPTNVSSHETSLKRLSKESKENYSAPESLALSSHPLSFLRRKPNQGPHDLMFGVTSFDSKNLFTRRELKEGRMSLKRRESLVSNLLKNTPDSDREVRKHTLLFSLLDVFLGVKVPQVLFFSHPLSHSFCCL